MAIIPVTSKKGKVYLCSTHIDMRKGVKALRYLIETSGVKENRGDAFIFINKDNILVKMLVIHKNK